MKEIELMKCDNTIFADEIVNKLNEAGIDARQHDETTDPAVGAYGPIVGIAIFVDEKDESRAKAIVKPIVEAREKDTEKMMIEDGDYKPASECQEKHQARLVVAGLLLVIIGFFILGMSNNIGLSGTLSIVSYVVIALGVIVILMAIIKKKI
jgi:hypothetical protein